MRHSKPFTAALALSLFAFSGVAGAQTKDENYGYRFDDDLMVGDTLFAGSIGRTDLPGGDYATLIDSIERVLLSFPDDVPVHPGHYGATTIGKERSGNPFLR
jgi:glyoxylase-like metal-dependent hydrolase (beta-lactamase superfamily II)